MFLLLQLAGSQQMHIYSFDQETKVRLIFFLSVAVVSWLVTLITLAVARCTLQAVRRFHQIALQCLQCSPRDKYDIGTGLFFSSPLFN